MADKRVAQIKKKRVKQKKERTLASKLFSWFIKGSIISIVLFALVSYGTYSYFTINLPTIATLKDYTPKTLTTVYSDDGRKIGEFYKQRRIVIPLSSMPDMLKKAFVAAEDARFYQHKGVDFISIVRAFIKNVRAGAIVQGGSTITQQVTKNFLLTSEKSYNRKIKEAILAYRINKRFSKNDVLFMYLNDIYLGHSAYGVEAAAENYFGKSASQLNLAECAILAGLPQAPSKYSPFYHQEKAKQRQIYVLNRMVVEGYITNIEATEAINTPLDIKPRKNWFIEKVPFYTEYVRRYINEKYGSKTLYEGGLKVYTAVNIEMQKSAREELAKGLKALDKRQGYRGPLENLEIEKIEEFSKKLEEEYENNPLKVDSTVKGVVIEVDNENDSVTVRVGKDRGIITIENMKWARKPNPEVKFYEGKIAHPGDALKSGDVILVKLLGYIGDEKDPKDKKEKEEKKEEVVEEDLDGAVEEEEKIWSLALDQEPVVQGAVLTIENETGFVKTMVGGRDYRESQFNRAIQSKRQPGSAIKPIIYAAAVDKGYTPSTMIVDSPVIVKGNENDFTWKPKNYGKKFYGPTLLRKALGRSYNVITVKILRRIGIDYAINYAKKLGITSHLRREGGLALGSSGVSLLEIVRAYSVFPNQGYLADAIFITKIEDRDGNVLEEFVPAKKQVMEMSTAYIMTSLLETVVKGGAGWRGSGYKLKALKRPVAGKTGTSNKQNDAWFVGFTPGYSTGTWVGHDVETYLGWGETGTGAASPIWLGYMQTALKDKPVRVFQVPEGIVFAKIDAETGLLPIPESKATIFECFKEGTVPVEYTEKPEVIDESEEFWKYKIE